MRQRVGVTLHPAAWPLSVEAAQVSCIPCQFGLKKQIESELPSKVIAQLQTPRVLNRDSFLLGAYCLPQCNLREAIISGPCIIWLDGFPRSDGTAFVS